MGDEKGDLQSICKLDWCESHQTRWGRKCEEKVSLECEALSEEHLGGKVIDPGNKNLRQEMLS